MVTTVITFSCDVEDAVEIDRYCKLKGYSRSWFIRECVMQVVDGRVPLMPREMRALKVSLRS
ncbi:MAG: ribbon-helix-helix protein, CopG family [Nitrososphaerota archaeon]